MTFVMVCCLPACRDNAEIPDHGPVVHPQEEAKGIYTGEWTRTDEGTGIVTTASGTMELTPSEYNYVANVSVKCAEINLDLSAPANITPGGQGYQFSNPEKDNPLGAIFVGDIKKSDMSAFMTFRLTVKEGRKTYTYLYVFNGKRQ